MALMKIDKLSVSYEGDPAVRDVSFRVEEGDYLVILGDNGSGKSSLMKAMLGLVKYRGAIDRAGLSGGAVGYLPQQTAAQRDFPASVEEVVRSGLTGRMRRPFFSRADKAHAREQMELMEMYPLRKRPFRALSGGQQQRALLARALCAAEKMLLLDEPVTGLDPQAAKEMYDLIRMLNGRGMAIVTVSHDMEGALADARHVLVMKSGGAEFFGDMDEYRVWRDANG